MVFFSSGVFFTSCKKDSELAPTTDEKISAKENLLAATATVSTQGYNVENSLPKGYVKNGTVDYTSYLQDAINKNSNVIFPAFPIMVSDVGLKVGSNKTLTFLKGSEIRLKPSSKPSYNIFRLDRVTNVTLNNPVIVGDKAKHTGTAGDLGMGIGIYSSSNIKLVSPVVHSCWGDGIYIGRTGTGYAPSSNITITDAYLNKNRRDGISIVSVNGLKLDRPYAAYTSGTRPSCGINIEPNNNEDAIKNVIITSPVTEYNDGSGIQIGVSNFLKKGDTQIDVTINNHQDLGSKNYAFDLACYRYANYVGKLSGKININNPVWKNAGVKPYNMWLTESTVTAAIVKPTIFKTGSSVPLTIAQINSLLKTGFRAGTAVVNH